MLKTAIKIFAYIFVFIMLMLLIFVCIFEHCDKHTQTSIVSNYSHTIDNFYIEDGCNIESTESINSFIDNFPSSFVTEFRNDWKVIIGNDIPRIFLEREGIPLNYKKYGITIDGYTNWQTRVIFIREQSDVNQMLKVFIHELGHCLDFEYGSISYSDKFQEIYLFLQDSFVEQDPDALKQYGVTSNVEFFATCFKEYVLFPEHLKSQSAEAYAFINNFYNDIKNMKSMFVYDFEDIICTFRRLTRR